MDIFCDNVPFHDLDSLSHNTDWYRLVDIAFESVMHQNCMIDYDAFFEKIKEHYNIDDEAIVAYKLREKLEQLITTLSYLKNKRKLVEWYSLHNRVDGVGNLVPCAQYITRLLIWIELSVGLCLNWKFFFLPYNWIWKKFLKKISVISPLLN